MDEEEDWDAPATKTVPKPSSPPPPQNDTSTPIQSTTLKITDGYKYSYEALASPANVEDWVEPSSYGGPKRSNGYSQNSYSRDNNRSRNDKSFENKRYFYSLSFIIFVSFIYLIFNLKFVTGLIQ